MAWGDFFTAYLGNYTQVVSSATDGSYGLDYAPGRLLVMSLWVKSLREHNPPIQNWENTYEATWPLLAVNTVCESICALTVIALVRHWRRARNGWRILPHWRHPSREWPALLAGLAVWFNPALIWNAHAWPQWDVWLLPFFLLGVLAMSKERWLLGGFILMIGAAFKGQVLMVTPVLLIWPIFAGKPLASVRMLIGMAMTASLVALPWMFQTRTAVAWLAGFVVVSVLCLLLLGHRRKLDRIAAIAIVPAIVVIACVMVRPNHGMIYVVGVVLIVLCVVLPPLVPRRWWGPLVGAQLAIAVYATGLAFGGSFDWFEIGYRYPQRHYPTMVVSGSNLPHILRADPFNWQLNDPVNVSWLPDMTIRTLLICIFSLTLLACSIAAVVHWRRRSPRFLLAISVPWLTMFTIMPQMHERYLLWASVVFCMGMGISVGNGLLALVVIFYAWSNMALPMLNDNPDLLPFLTRLIRGMNPGDAYVLVLLALVCLYSAIEPDRKPVEIEDQPLP